MALIGGLLARSILSRFSPSFHLNCGNDKSAQADGLVQSFGSDFFERIKGKRVLDFGCGNGYQAVSMAGNGAESVFGLEIDEGKVRFATELSARMGLRHKCTFGTQTSEQFDCVVSRDAFEHFSDPEGMLRLMEARLAKGGQVFASFGPTWLHPYGGHLFSVFPWAHLVLSEQALIEWRSQFRSDGAKRFSEVEGGLNQLTIKQFVAMIQRCNLKLVDLELVPIRRLEFLRSRPLREFGTSLVRCQLEKQ